MSTFATGKATDILRDRAQALAQVPKNPLPAGARLSLLQFRMAQERYAVEDTFVEGVSPLGHLTPLPCTPPFIRGIVNIRGRVVAVLDLTQYFGLPATGLTDLHRIILVQGNGMEMGLLVDEILGVGAISADSLHAGLPTLTGTGSRFLKGITSERVVVLDLQQLFSDPGLVINEEVI